MYLNKEKIVQREWREVNTSEEIKNVINKLRKKEKELLPNKKKRALSVAEKLLNSIPSKDLNRMGISIELIENLVKLFNPANQEEAVIDYNRFADIWLSIFQPALDEKKKKPKRKRQILTLRDLTLEDIKLTSSKLTSIYESCQIATTLDEMISSCIIAVKS